MVMGSSKRRGSVAFSVRLRVIVGAIAGASMLAAVIAAPAAVAAPRPGLPTSVAPGPFAVPKSVPGGVTRSTIPNRAPALAASEFGWCAGDGLGFCTWADANYGGWFYQYDIWSWGQNSWHEVLVNDNASSLYNHRVHSTYINKNWPPGGNGACLPPEFAISNLKNYVWPNGSSMNDSISAFDLLSSNPC